jgi:hypothetical protein
MLEVDITQTLFAQMQKAGRERLWDIIPETLRPAFALVWFFVELFVMAGVFYIAGLIVVGGKRARFSDAFIISLLGTVLSTLFMLFIPYKLVALLLSLFTWLLLIKRLYETGWLGAIAVGILAVIVYFAILVLLVLAVVGIFIIEDLFTFMILLF